MIRNLFDNFNFHSVRFTWNDMKKKMERKRQIEIKILHFKDCIRIFSILVLFFRFYFAKTFAILLRIRKSSNII